MALIETERSARRRPRFLLIILVLLALLLGARSIASLIVEYAWWNELGQLATWQSILLYSFAPVVLAAVITFVILWLVHARALKFAGTALREHRPYGKLSTAVLAVLSLLIARASLDSWTTVSFYGAQRAGTGANVWRDPIFGHALTFYLFELPFYSQLLGLVLTISFVSALLFYVVARGWQLVQKMPRWRGDVDVTLTPADLMLSGGLESAVLRGMIGLVLLALAARAYLARYGFLDDDHGFLVGVDYLNHWVGIPLQWVAVGGFVTAALLVWFRRWKLAALPLLVVLLRGVVPPIVSAAYVKPNEISLQAPYIQHHIQATRAAWGLDARLKEIPFPAKLEAPLTPEKNQPILDNVRLWDWRAFHDTVTQIQALRQYYVFSDTDVDRYHIDGQLRQVMLTPRELDIRQLPDARNWINAHFIYTHGYGLVLAEANRITANGQPVLFVQDAPPKVQTDSLKLTRPEIYYGEVMHEPVFVRTQQPEFNYPSGSENVHTRYEGTGGIPVGNFGMRLAAALATADRNVLLTGYLTGDSRMLIHRNVRNRVNKLASFIEWDSDPYLVLTDAGRLVWVLDGYTTSSRHPYAHRLRIDPVGAVNYIRNSVKATVDAYDGSVTMYVFDAQDPIVRAFQAIFPDLFQPASAMPADVRSHARYPELMFRAQAEVYRTFHMQDPEAFYNREDLWDLAKDVYAQNNQPEPLPPTFVVATLPGESKPEFLLMQPFTPRSKDNLIGMMVARSDGEHLGEIVVLQLSKQSLIYGPLQVDARIGSDSNIAKDLSLWNQQGSQVLRGQMLVLPINDTFLYVEPIYIQSNQARMPQLKKVALALGNRLVYRDTYEEALAELTGGVTATPVSLSPGPSAAAGDAPATPSVTAPSEPKLDAVRGHMRRYRELASQGKWAEAGRELEALEKLVAR